MSEHIAYSTTPPPAELLDVARSMRAIHVRMIESSLGRQETGGTCFYACILLQEAVSKFAKCVARVRGGGSGDGGYFDGKQEWGHYWVEARDSAGNDWVVDVTADQFGDAELVVSALPEARLKYRPGQQAITDENVRQFHASLNAAG